MQSPPNKRIDRNELVSTNLIYATNDDDKIEVDEKTKSLMAGNLKVALVLVVSSQGSLCLVAYGVADDFGKLFEEPQRDLKGELLAAADSMSYRTSALPLDHQIWSNFVWSLREQFHSRIVSSKRDKLNNQL